MKNLVFHSVEVCKSTWETLKNRIFAMDFCKKCFFFPKTFANVLKTFANFLKTFANFLYVQKMEGKKFTNFLKNLHSNLPPYPDFGVMVYEILFLAPSCFRAVFEFDEIEKHVFELDKIEQHVFELFLSLAKLKHTFLSCFGAPFRRYARF